MKITATTRDNRRGEEVKTFLCEFDDGSVESVTALGSGCIIHQQRRGRHSVMRDVAAGCIVDY